MAVEGDWPDCYLINRFVKECPDSAETTGSVLENFIRWLTLTWANWEIAALMECLYEFNHDKSVNKMAGFYGLDMYSMCESFDIILNYLKQNDPESLQATIEPIECIDPYSIDTFPSVDLVPENCSDEIVNMLVRIRDWANTYEADPEASFNMNQNVRVVLNAEKYYRVMGEIGPQSWNLRDEHITETLMRLLEYHGSDAKAGVWKHNTHIGDAQALDMHAHVGQLVREKLSTGTHYVPGFGFHEGTVMAANSWGSRMQIMKVPKPRIKVGNPYCIKRV